MIGQEQEIERIDEIVRGLDDDVTSQHGLLRENLLTARVYMLNSMPDELHMQLQLLRERLPQVDPSDLRTRVKTLVEDLEEVWRNGPK